MSIAVQVIPTKLMERPDGYLPKSIDSNQYVRIFTSFINSGLHPKTFLQRIQYPNPDNVEFQRRLHSDLRWYNDNTKDAPEILIRTEMASTADLPAQNWPPNLFDELISINTEFTTLLLDPAATTELALSDPNELAPDPALTPSEQISLWRSKLAFDDWKSAQYVRQRVMSVVKNITPENFKPADIRSIAATLLDIQKIQRLALGLSSDNLGFKMDGKNQDGEDLPIINVMIADSALSQSSGSPDVVHPEPSPDPTFAATGVVDGELEPEDSGQVPSGDES